MIIRAFNKWTTTRKTKSGYSVTCKKGLWSIHAPSKDDAFREALRYFAQYYSDGEYEDDKP